MCIRDSFTVAGSDLSGNTFLVDNLTWSIPEGAGDIRAGTNSGEWIITGHKMGDWLIELYSEDAQHNLQLSVTSGLASRIEVILSGDQFLQGDDIIIVIRIFDSFNNSVTVSPSDLQVSSTVGPATHVNQGSWKIVTETGGADHAVTIRHNGITVQKYFDVQGALLGGALGSSDTVILSGTFIIAIILGTLIITMRRMKDESSEEKVDLADDIELSVQPSPAVQPNQPEDKIDPVQPEPQSQIPQPTQDEIAAQAAAKAKATGVMVAAEGTIQGQTGWYYDATGELTNWEIDAEGRWNRLG